MKMYLFQLLTIMMVTILSIGVSSCSKDEDDNSDSTGFLVGEWQECDFNGNFTNDATGNEVMHMKLYSDGKGDWWSITKGKKDEHWYSFNYSYTLNGTSGTVTMTITSSSKPSEVGQTVSLPITYENGILHSGEIYYKKKQETNDEENNKVDESMKSFTTCPDSNHPHAIDLGLPSGTRWACCNVGASTPEDYGNYYAWGETSPKRVYNSDTYLYYFIHLGGYADIGSDIAGTIFDAATANWGSPWHMPTKAQYDELCTYCSSVWITQYGVNGRNFTGPSGGTIFLPAAGRYNGSHLYYAGSRGYSWSSTFYENNPRYAWDIGFESQSVFTHYDDDAYHYGRSCGNTVRPVR